MSDTVNGLTASSELSSPNRKIIRTADFKCRVQNVFNTTTTLESLVKSVGGVVEQSKIENDISEEKTLAFKPDSLKQVQTYKTIAHLTLRVPFQSLDTVVHTLPVLSTFIDSRLLAQEDVTLKYLSNALRNDSLNNGADIKTILKSSKNTSASLTAVKYLDDKREDKINRQMDNLQLMENVNYATLNIDLYQPEQVIVSIIPNPDYFINSTFSEKAISAFKFGWELLQNIVLLFINIWFLVLILIIALLIVRKIKAKKSLQFNKQ